MKRSDSGVTPENAGFLAYNSCVIAAAVLLQWLCLRDVIASWRLSFREAFLQDLFNPHFLTKRGRDSDESRLLPASGVSRSKLVEILTSDLESAIKCPTC